MFVCTFGRIFGHVAVLIQSCCLCSLQECAASSGYLWFPCFLSYTVVSKQAKHLHKQLARKKKPTRENSTYFFVFGQGYIYEGIRPSDYIRHLAWAKRASLNGGEWPF